MAQPISWTQQADEHLLRMRADGQPWTLVARKLSVGRNAAIERSRRLGLAPIRHPRPGAPKPAPERTDRPPLPAGHPVTWKTITDNSPLEGEPYPFPVFA